MSAPSYALAWALSQLEPHLAPFSRMVFPLPEGAADAFLLLPAYTQPGTGLCVTCAGEPLVARSALRVAFQLLQPSASGRLRVPETPAERQSHTLLLLAPAARASRRVPAEGSGSRPSRPDSPGTAVAWQGI